MWAEIVAGEIIGGVQDSKEQPNDCEIYKCCNPFFGPGPWRWRSRFRPPNAPKMQRDFTDAVAHMTEEKA